MNSDLEPPRRELIETLETLLGMHDEYVYTRYAGTSVCSAVLARADFARRVLARAKKNAKQTQTSESLERRTGVHDAPSDTPVELEGQPGHH